jgi:O-antigen biosynthesis protein WbqP
MFTIFFLIIFILIKLTSKGPAIFWSKRIGIDKKFFLMPKFRTMITDTPNVATHLLEEPDKYTTPIGSFLRKTSLDELPQLLSVIKGDMTFVGPRPALFNQNDLINMRETFDIFDLKPGITGWAQIQGRDSISIEEKVKLDNFYKINKNFFLDIYIIFKTIIRVFHDKNISH